MNNASQFEPETVRRLLHGDDAAVAQALALVQEHLCDHCCHWLRQRYPRLPAEDLADSWAETIAGVYQAARRGDLPEAANLATWVWGLADARATDRVRRLAARERLVVAVGLALRDTATGQRWRELDPLERHEVLELFAEAIAFLPAQQQVVLQVFVDHFPKSQRMAFLREQVSKMTGRPETLASVKRALQEGRRKVRTFLCAKGYALGKGGEA